MSEARVKKLHDHAAEIGTPAISHTVPSLITHGISIVPAAGVGVFREDVWEVYLEHSTGGTITITAGAYLLGWDAGRAQWSWIGILNNGNAVTLTATVGFAERVLDLGAFSRIAVVDTGDTGTHVYGAVPLEHN